MSDFFWNWRRKRAEAKERRLNERVAGWKQARYILDESEIEAQKKYEEEKKEKKRQELLNKPIVTIAEIDAKYTGMFNPDRTAFFGKAYPKAGSDEEKWYYLTKEGHHCFGWFTKFSYSRAREVFFDEIGIEYTEDMKKLSTRGLLDLGYITNEEASRLHSIDAAAVVHHCDPPITIWNTLLSCKEGHAILFWAAFIIIGSILQAIWNGSH